MYKVITKHRPEYKTPVKVYSTDDKNEAVEIAAETEQQFGQAIILTDGEFKELINQNKDDEKKRI